MRLDLRVVARAANGRRPVTPEIAVRLARALGKPVESLYAPPSDARVCPTCGRGGAS